MMDYTKTRDEALKRKQELAARIQEIATERAKLAAQIEQAKRELIGLDQILEGVEFMTTDISPDLEPPGFTDKIRKILSETSVPLVPTQVRDALEANGVKGSSSRNLLINVHTVIERISDELEKSITPEGKAAYRRKIPWPKPTLFELLVATQQPPQGITTFGNIFEKPGKADMSLGSLAFLETAKEDTKKKK